MKYNSRISSLVCLLSFTLLAGGASTVSYAATPLICKTGMKPGKTAISLVIGAKPKCVNIAQAASGKKLLNSTSNTCFLCHNSNGIVPPKSMISNLRDQGYTLSVTDITAAFTAHASEMGTATITPKDAKSISNYLQSIK